MSKYFITGAGGFIGSHVVKKLTEMGHEIVTDMRHLHTRKFDAVIHLAAKNNIKNEFDADLIESNIVLTREIFKTNCRIVYASSCVAEFPLNPYAYSKLYSEHLAAIHGNAIGLRFHNVYGPGNGKGIVWWLMQQPDGAKVTIRGANQIRDYIFISDVVNEIITYLKVTFENFWEGKPLTGVVDIGTGVGTTTLELVQLYRKLSGKNFELEFAPAGANEPEKMVASSQPPNCISLETGLKKLIEECQI